MYDNDVYLEDVVEILETGFDCSRSKRAGNIIERCIQRGDRIFKVVVVDANEHMLIAHVGTFKASRKKMQQFKRR